MYGKFILFLVTHWPESSALDNAADFCLAILPMTLPPKNFCLKLPNSVRNAKIILKAMPLAMLPTKSLQHCQDQMIRANVIRNIAKQKSAALSRADDSGQYFSTIHIKILSQNGPKSQEIGEKC